MRERYIRFGRFLIPRLNEFKYLQSEECTDNDFLFVNEPHGAFSIYFEEGFPRFLVPDRSDRDYCLLEVKRPNKMIRLFCPARHRRLCSVIWYFYVELFDENGEQYCLPGQMCVNTEDNIEREIKHQTVLLTVLEQIQLYQEPNESQESLHA